METFADYKKEREAFFSLMEPDCAKRIQFFRGGSGTGKTSLIKFCRDGICESANLVPIELRKSSVGIAEIFWRTGSQLGWDQFPTFTEQLSRFSGVNVNIDRNRIKGDRNRIQVVLYEDPDEREYRRTLLTDAWFNDINELHTLFLVAMDTYEQATIETKEWISGPFLTRTVDTEKIRVAIAGQQIPEDNTIDDWGRYCEIHELFGVKEAEHWMPVVEALGRIIPVEPSITWMSGICHALEGRPDAIMKIIQGLPLKQ